jgi:hypothetical protein
VKVSVSPRRKRHGVGAVKSERSGKNDEAGKCAQILKGVQATENESERHDSAEITV